MIDHIKVSSPYKVFNLVAGANMSEKTPQYLWVWYIPLSEATETTLYSSENES